MLDGLYSFLNKTKNPRNSDLGRKPIKKQIKNSILIFSTDEDICSYD
jgi:hypothetical protein